MFEQGKYYKINEPELRRYMKNLYPQTVAIIKKMLKRTGDNTLYVCSPDIGGYVEVAENPVGGMIGSMRIPTSCLVSNAEFHLEQITTVAMNILMEGDNRALLNAKKIDETLKSIIKEFYPYGPQNDAQEEVLEEEEDESEFSMENTLRTEAVDVFTTAVQSLEDAFAALYLASEKCRSFNIENLGTEGYPFSENIQTMYHAVIAWNKAQKIAAYKRTGEEPS